MSITTNEHTHDMWTSEELSDMRDMIQRFLKDRKTTLQLAYNGNGYVASIQWFYGTTSHTVSAVHATFEGVVARLYKNINEHCDAYDKFPRV